LPHLEAAHVVDQQAAALEVIRGGDATRPDEKLAIDRQLMHLYHGELGDPAAAWIAGLRVVAADPGDADVRGALGHLAGQLGRDGEWARVLDVALAALREPRHPFAPAPAQAASAGAAPAPAATDHDTIDLAGSEGEGDDDDDDEPT